MGKKNNEPIHKLIESYVAVSFEKKPSKADFLEQFFLKMKIEKMNLWKKISQLNMKNVKNYGRKLLIFPQKD